MSAKKYTTDSEKITKVLDDIDELGRLLTARISDFHEVKGMMQARHAYILYRERLWGIRNALLESLKEDVNKPVKKKQ